MSLNAKLANSTEKFSSCGLGKYLLIFALAVLLRALPEILSGVYPIGFDTISGYVPAVVSFPNTTPLASFGWLYSPLVVFLLGAAHVLTRIDPYLLMKIAGPLFYGVFCGSFCFFLSRGLGWSNKKSALVSLLLLLEPAILRMGWDQFREEIALSFLFILLALTNTTLIASRKSKLLAVFSLSLLIIFSHQLAAILLFVILAWQLLTDRSQNMNAKGTTLIAALPAIALFSWQLYSQFLTPQFDPNYMPLQLPNNTGNFIFTNYFISDPRFLGTNYGTVFTYVGMLLLFTVVPLFPFAVKGFFKEKAVLPMLLWLVPMGLSILVYPYYAFSQYWWWILLLPIPFTVYAGNYIAKKVSTNKKACRTAAIGFALLAIISIGYATSTIRVGGLDYVNSYGPGGMVESSIPINDIPNAERAFNWVNTHAPSDAIIVVPEKFQGIAFLDLNHTVRIRIAQALLSIEAVVKANGQLLNSKDVYFVYYINDADLNGTLFTEIATFGEISVYQLT